MVRDGYESNSSASASTEGPNSLFGPLKLLWDVSKLHFACYCGEEPTTTRDSYPVSTTLCDWLCYANRLHIRDAFKAGQKMNKNTFWWFRNVRLVRIDMDFCCTVEPPLIRKGTVPYRSWRSLWSPFQQTRCESATLSPVLDFSRFVAVIKVYVYITTNVLHYPLDFAPTIVVYIY